MSQRKGKEVEKSKNVIEKKKEFPKPIAIRRNAIGIIGGIESGRDECFHREAIELGKAIACRQLNVVYGGGVLGLSATVAVTAMNRGSRVLGITVGSFSGASSAPSLGDELRVRNPQERTMYMLRNADAFVVVPSGLDGMEVFSSLLSWANINLHQKPLGFLNVNGFFDGLLTHLIRLGEQGFITPTTSQLVVSASTSGPLIERLMNLMEVTSLIIGEPVIQHSRDKRKRDDPEKDGPDTDLKL